MGRQVSDRAKASEMEHAIRHHIKKKLDEDPVHYQKLSERLDEILTKLKDDWAQQVLALQDFIEEAGRGRQEEADGLGLDPQLHAPFFDVLKEEREKEAPVRGANAKWLAEVTVDMVERIVRDEVRVIGFWKNATRQEALRARLFEFLDDHDLVGFDRLGGVADRLMELAKANRGKLEKES